MPTNLSIDGVIKVFNRPDWEGSYGGAKWAQIAEMLKKLKNALDAKDEKLANELCRQYQNWSTTAGRWSLLGKSGRINGIYGRSGLSYCK